jgi:hypothetical protein
VRRNLIDIPTQGSSQTLLHTRQRRETYRTEGDDRLFILETWEGGGGSCPVPSLVQLLANVITNSLPSTHLHTHRSHKHSEVAAAIQIPAHLATHRCATPLTCDGTPVAYNPFKCIFHQAIQTRVSGQRTIKLVICTVDLSDIHYSW